MHCETRVVDNRVFLLGLDMMYRAAIKKHERDELLFAARATAETLSVAPADVPIEGYYGEDENLTEYFRTMRALQIVPKSRKPELASHDGYARLKQVTGSPIFGPLGDQDSILPAGDDCLAVALGETFPSWNIPTITDKAYQVAVSSDEFSLVALAALSRDPVVIAALRESVVLYAMLVGGCGFIEEPRYVWQVDDEISSRAKRFVAQFNDLFSESLPTPDAQNAEAFWIEYTSSEVLGRCVRIGFDDSVQPVRQYHWAIDRDRQYQILVKDFWDTDIWTTARYREAQEQDM
jgi:hypothetical protein